MLMVILIVGGVLRLFALGRWSLWTDELYNLGLMPVSALLAQGIPADQHPPLYYLILELVLKLGQSEWLMRLPSALAGLLTIPVMGRIGAALNRPKLGLAAAALLALAPLHVWYSREARMYGLAMLFWAAAVYFYLQSWQRDKWLDTLGLVFTMTGGLYTAYPTVALWFIQLALGFLFWQLFGGVVTRLGRWLLAQIVIAGLFYAWWPFLERQLERPLVFNWINFFESLFGAQTAGQLNQWLQQQGLTTTLAGTFQLAILSGLLFVLVSFLLSLIIVRRPTILSLAKKWQLPIAVFITLVFLTLMVAGAVPRGLSLRRQLLVFWILLIIPAAWAIVRLRNRWLLAGTLLLSFLLSLYAAFGPAYEDWRSGVAVVADQGQAEDLVFIAPYWSTAAFSYYDDGDISHYWTNLQEAQENEAVLVQARRVWLVVNDHPALTDLTADAETWFLENGRLLNSYQYSLYITVYEMEFGR